LKRVKTGSRRPESPPPTSGQTDHSHQENGQYSALAQPVKDHLLFDLDPSGGFTLFLRQHQF
jgi:hypothetical protein